MCGPPLLSDACCSNKQLEFCLLHGSAFAVDFAILLSNFWYRRFQTWDRESAFLFSFSKLFMRYGTPGGFIFGPCLDSFLIFFVSGLQKRNVLVSIKLCGLWRPEGQLGRSF